MKRSAKPLIPQMNLPLLDAPATVPGEKQEELALTLMEILIKAARENGSFHKPTEGKMNQPKLTAERLVRKALVYIRQSKPSQVLHHQESQRRQYGLGDRARELGFREVEVIDEDLGAYRFRPG